MADRRRATCKRCRRHVRDVGPISWAGYCGDCGPEIFERNNDDLHYHRGPYFLHWRRQSVAALGAILLDDLDPEQ